jgi:hypothetical protein
MGLLALHVGLDIGQQHDPTALVVAAVGDRYDDPAGRQTPLFHEDNLPRTPGTPIVTSYQVQTMQRLDLGTQYTKVAAAVAATVAALWEWEIGLRQRKQIIGLHRIPRALWIDATGVGRPVVELILDALKADGRCDRTSVHPVTFTHGDRYIEHGPFPETASLGKAFLVSRLQVLLQQRQLALPRDHPEARAMARELKDYEIRVDGSTSNDTYGAFKTGSYDDLVTALGLACLVDPHSYGMRSGPSLWQ